MVWQDISALPKGLDEEVMFQSEYGETVTATPDILKVREQGGYEADFPSVDEPGSYIGSSRSAVTHFAYIP